MIATAISKLSKILNWMPSISHIFYDISFLCKKMSTQFPIF